MVESQKGDSAKKPETRGFVDYMEAYIEAIRQKPRFWGKTLNKYLTKLCKKKYHRPLPNKDYGVGKDLAKRGESHDLSDT